MGTLWNTYAFYVLYANIDEFDPTKYSINYDELNVMDKWLLSRLNSTVKAVDDHLDNYRIPEAAKALDTFVDEMSNWYVRRGRERYWVQGLPQNKIDAYMVLYTALVTVCKAAAPMIPFMTEEIYQNLMRSVDKNAPESIHLCDYPAVNEAWIDRDLEAAMDEVLSVVVLGRAARNGANIKNRQPLANITVVTDKVLGKEYTDIIRDELNVKEVIFTDSASGLVSYSFKPQLKTLGPKYGKQLGEIRTLLASLDGASAKKELDRQGHITLKLSTGDIELTADDLLISAEQLENSFAVTDNGYTVALDTELTDELIAEGFVREIISKVQTMRKDADFNVTDHIDVTIKGSEKLEKIIADHLGDIAGDVLADSVKLAEPEGTVKEWDINGENAVIGVKVV